jgi:hypothetical protein
VLVLPPYSANSSSSQTLDAPIYQQNINISGTFGNRNLSIYAKGLLFDKLSYQAYHKCIARN